MTVPTNRRLRRFAMALAALSALAACDKPSTTSASARSPQALQTPSLALAGRVTDAANILSPATMGQLTSTLAALEKRTGHQMVVATVPDLGGQPIEDYARNLGNRWGIGRKEYNDGVVILMAPRERKIHISVGYGLESKLPNSLCQSIIDEAMLPRFRANDYAGGLAAGVDALITHL